MPGTNVKEFNNFSFIKVVFCDTCGENLGQTPNRYGDGIAGHGIEDCIRYVTKRLDEAADNCPGRERGEE